MSDTVIKVDEVSKKYCRSLKHTMLYGATDLARSFLGFNQQTERLRNGEFWALSEVNFEIKRGETVGLIGPNGSGKSTLLKMLNGIMMPDKGRIEINGRVGALIEVGAGFHPMLTGRENVYINGAILGMSKKEIDRKFEEIVDFAGIDDFIDSPVKHYSSGMYVRLGFAIAAHAEPDILLVDEVLAVGDIRFQQKCFRKINEFRGKGKTILLITHDTSAVKSLCDRVVWINEGKILRTGSPNEVVRDYSSYMAFDETSTTVSCDADASGGNGQNLSEIEWEDVAECPSFGEGGAEIKRVALHKRGEAKAIKAFEGGKWVVLRLEIEAKRDIQNPIVGFILNNQYGVPILGLNNTFLGKEMEPLKKGQSVLVNFEFKFPRLGNGPYTFSTAIAEGTQENHIQHHWVHDAYVVKIESSTLASRSGFIFLVDDAEIKIDDLNSFKMNAAIF